MKLMILRNSLSVVGPELAEAKDRLAPGLAVPSSFTLHITLLSKAEYIAVGRPSIPENLSLSSVHILGVGSAGGRGDPQDGPAATRWLVVVWNHGNAFRHTLGLRSKDFHITLTDTDVHDIDKGILSLEGGLHAAFDAFSRLGEDAADHTLASRKTAWHPELARWTVRTWPESYKALIRLADEYVNVEPKIAMLAYIRAFHLNPELQTYISRRLARMGRDEPAALWGPIVTQEEKDMLDQWELTPRLLVAKRWDPSIIAQLGLHTLIWTAPTEPRKRLCYLDRPDALPRLFSWLVPHRLAAMSTPRNENDIDTLADMGVTLVLTLTAEEPLEDAWFAFKRIRQWRVPVDNYEAPSVAEMDLIYRRFTADADGRWLVHCGGGKGRAGTVVACLLAMHQNTDNDLDSGSVVSATPTQDASAIIRQLRVMRPGSIETSQQEAFVKKWISHRWRLASEFQLNELEEDGAATTPIDIQLDRKAFPNGRLALDKLQILIFIGLPGSGKSWLASAIAKRRPRGKTLIISQDESRSRSACEAAIGRNHTVDTLVILDRCNVDPTDRKIWLSLVQSEHAPVAVYFDYQPETCRRRINSRIGHPTLRAGQGEGALRQMSSTLSKPILAEGFGAIITISAFRAACEAALLLGGEVGIHKFPRTTHLVRTAAVTPDDLVLEGFSHLLTNVPLTLEEKVDGANMGFTLAYDRHTIVVQNRSHYVNCQTHAQFRPLDTWLERNSDALREILDRDEQFPERYILFGEWLVATHSIHYTKLADLFLAFDLYDRFTDTFLSRRLLTRALHDTGIHQVPLIKESTHQSREDLLEYMTRPSAFYDGPVEGAYVRVENADRTRTLQRYKVVRSDFIVGNEHWTRGPLQLNKVAFDT
ncbi:unnamed protein product [Tilletia laevis]|uniref:Tyrosine specific protein phosphatases domain-containing protein n=3 Tax=Tilletia TaxID=13289 RepID=A0A8X7MW57_9BASI|nr:hypothetical protein CF328_g2137 [Tilletia controversa]KAE8263308.1 hypothetical protein A4X03_0g1783 [Tilletia caries]CAD6943726.1 unnamed protein product [Tilletia laevis]KAE8251647.1 hypothetical protein A4X06_0g2589 [Tilletia controversa]CAD6890606.1 unnamed protein product [Tilletia caries]